jgi:hypothetical protein
LPPAPGMSVAEAARDLRVGDTLLREWIDKARAELGSAAISGDERSELAQLRPEVRILNEKREILKKPRPSSRRRVGLETIRVHLRVEGRLVVAVPMPSAGGEPFRLVRLDARQNFREDGTREALRFEGEGCI